MTSSNEPDLGSHLPKTGRRNKKALAQAKAFLFKESNLASAGARRARRVVVIRHCRSNDCYSQRNRGNGTDSQATDRTAGRCTCARSATATRAGLTACRGLRKNLTRGQQRSDKNYREFIQFHLPSDRINAELDGFSAGHLRMNQPLD